jgi:hypothetical protein
MRKGGPRIRQRSAEVWRAIELLMRLDVRCPSRDFACRLNPPPHHPHVALVPPLTELRRD